MRTVPLGVNGPSVSAMCLGAMYFGSRNSVEVSHRMLDQYVAAGGTFIDTANIYARWVEGYVGGESERLLGAWMRQHGNRDQMFIATKVGFPYPGSAADPGTPQGLKASQIEDECHKSLKRMGIDTIDLLYAHVDDPHTPLEESMAAFERLVKAGKVRYLGASNFMAWRLERAQWVSETNGWAKFVCLQQRYTYLRPKHSAKFGDQRWVDFNILEYCRAMKFPIVAYSVLLSGSYTRPDRPLQEQYLGPDSDARLAALHAVAGETGLTPNQVILAWMLQSDPVVIPLIAASTDEQMQENLKALDVRLSEADMARLNAASA